MVGEVSGSSHSIEVTVGAVVSAALWVELFMAGWSAKEPASLPEPSCTAALSLLALGSV